MQIGDFVTPKAPHSWNGRACRVIGLIEYDTHTSVQVAPLSNWQTDGISMAAAGFEKIAAPAGWEDWKPAADNGWGGGC